MKCSRRAGLLLCVLVLASVAERAAAQAPAQEPTRASELTRIVELLALQPGMTVADIGAGEGNETIQLAKRLGAQSRVYSTDLDRDALAAIRDRARRDGVENVTTVVGEPNATGLSRDCCDGILIRNTYHHFGDPATMNASILAALKAGGRLLIIDFPPTDNRDYPLSARTEGAGHGITPGAVAAELTQAGFTVVRTVEQWSSGRAFAVLAQKTTR